MTNSSIEDLKNEIADYYIKNFRKELGFLKGIALLPIKSTMKDILIGKKDLPEKFVEIEDFKFWKNVIQFLSPKLAKQIFDFLKEKRKEIVDRRTKEELSSLKNEILGITSNENGNAGNNDAGTGNDDPVEDVINSGGQGNNGVEEGNKEDEPPLNPIAGGVATSAGGTFAVYKMKSWVTNHEVSRIGKNLDEAKIRGTIDDAIEAMTKEKNILKSRLTPHQIETVDNHIAKLREGLESVDGNSGKLLEEWMSLGDKLPKSLLETCGINPRNLEKIGDIADDLYGKSIDDMRNLLKNKGIGDVDDAILECFSRAESGKQIKTMTRVLKGGSKFKKFIDTFAGAMRLDVAFLGLDVRTYLESNKEADIIDKINEARGKNKHNQAEFQLITGVSSVVVEGAAILISCMTTGAYGGWVGVIIGTVAGLACRGVGEAGNALYYDVKDFYLQNEVDFLRQTRGELKQAILQGIHNYKKGDTSFNEKFTTYWNNYTPFEDNPDLSPGSDVKKQSLNSACRSMIFLEELENGDPEVGLEGNSYLLDYAQSGQTKDDYLKDKDENFKKYFEEYWDKMQKRIDERMEYVKNEFEKEDVINSIYKGSGAHYLTQIFTESIGYIRMKNGAMWDNSKDYSENMQEYKKELFKDFPKEKVEKLESIRSDNPDLFLDIMTMSLTDFIGEDEENVDKNYAENAKLLERYKEYLSMTENLEDKRYLIVDKYKNGGFISNLLEVDFDLDRVRYETLDDDVVIETLGFGYERRGLTNISDNILQNILYGVAKELNGYSGENDLYSLMAFYNEGKGDVNGVYFSDKWVINDDWAIDASLYNNIPEIIYDKDVDEYVDRFIKNNFYTPLTDENGNYLYDDEGNIMYAQKSCIDTPTESIDNPLTKEMIETFKRIAKEEFSNHTEENKLKIKEEICNVVKQNSKGKYMELPYYLILKAKKAGLGDLQRQVFKRNDNVESYIPGLEPDDWSHIDVCYMDNYNITSIDSMCNKLYISNLRTTYTDEEKYYINRVEEARKKLSSIMSVTGWGITQSGRQEDDLDLPTDIKKIIADKAIEWDKFKELILKYNPKFCCNPIIIKKYEEYAMYFENLYRGILLSEAGFKMSNDIDSFDYFQLAVGCGYTSLFDETGNINPDLGNDGGFKFLHEQKFKDFYGSLLKEEVEVGNGLSESLEHLWKFGNSKEKELAKQTSYFIITTTLEKCLLPTDSVTGKVTGISKGKPAREGKKEEIKNSLKKYLSKKKIAPDISQENIEALVNGKREIKKMTFSERRTTDLAPIIEEAIRDNLPQVVWGYKRLQLRYDIDEQRVESWGENTKISFKEDGNNVSMKIDGLDIEFKDIKEGILVANLMNRLKRNMKENRIGTVHGMGRDLDYYHREGGSLMRNCEGTLGFNDVEILTEKVLDKWYPTIKNSDKFLNFINDLLGKISRYNGGFNFGDDESGEGSPASPAPAYPVEEEPQQP